ncbi:hypothetical protein SAMN05660330_01728 [Desulforhopalus singaporensis]|uniref:Uncharacterized protein n=1 Tax=Desulforhopalus singaporensis TaxID=91360 RepID=A0A1H0PQP7_9BACT|nr:hypothetical protein SAMN05660330_01728 [Desulforhopalus singaporensis]
MHMIQFLKLADQLWNILTGTIAVDPIQFWDGRRLRRLTTLCCRLWIE